MSSLHLHAALQPDLLPGHVLCGPLRWCRPGPRHPLGSALHPLLLRLLVPTCVQSLQVCATILIFVTFVTCILGLAFKVFSSPFQEWQLLQFLCLLLRFLCPSGRLRHHDYRYPWMGFQVWLINSHLRFRWMHHSLHFVFLVLQLA